MLDYGKPIRIFRDNLSRHGVQLHVREGRLWGTGNIENLSPAYQKEIKRRAELLIELLNAADDQTPVIK